jgi:signal transduction histidine kinase
MPKEINPVHLLNHQIVQDLPFGVVVVDRDLVIKDWNSWMDHWSGHPRAETQDRPLIEFFPDLEKRDLLKPILSIFETGQSVKYSYREIGKFLTFTGENCPADAGTMFQDVEIRPLLDLEGEVAMACIITHNMTEHAYRLQQLETLNSELADVNLHLKRANDVKSEFLQNTSHELRTPLTAILGFVDLLENDMVEGPDEEKEFLDNIRRSAAGLLDLINDILTSAKIQAHEIEVEINPLSLSEVMTEAHAILHPVAVKKNIHMTLDIEDPDILILADYQRLKQVLFNVIGNAIKFTEEGAVRIVVPDPGANGHATVIVKDSGIGIDPDKIHLVFEQFQQVDPTTSRKYGGTGLGMPISKSLMEYMNGTVAIESEGLGKGAIVTMTIPILRD